MKLLRQAEKCSHRLLPNLRFYSKAPLVAERYPNVKRRNDLAKFETSDVANFEKILGSHHVLTEDLEFYNEDWLGIYRGAAKCVLQPSTTIELSAVLRYCNERKLGVCVQSGNTGLVGGSIPFADEIIVSMQKLTGDLELDPDSGIVRIGAGRILQLVDEDISQHGYIMPYDLGAKGSCLVGGNVATAAGGIRFLRYGSIHANLLACTVVLADGTILRSGSACRKDNTGLHLPHLFCGSEGQLGIISEVTMVAAPKPKAVNIAMLAVPSFDKCLSILRMAKHILAEILSAFELIDFEMMKCHKENAKLTCPLDGEWGYYLVIEISGSNQEHDQSKLNQFISSCIDKELAGDGVLASSDNQAQHIWHLRESCAESLRMDGYTYKQDISLPLKYYVESRDRIRERVGSIAKRVTIYGHLADGNAHLNVTSDEYDPEIVIRLYPYLFEWTKEHGGSISAEHGIGIVKRHYAHYTQNAESLKLMANIKALVDPNRILNPYKTIPDI